MWRQKLRPALSAIPRRMLPLDPRLSIDPAAQMQQLCTNLSSLHSSMRGDPECRALPFPSYHFLGCLRFSGKEFCSASSDRVALRCWNCGAMAQTLTFLVCGDCRSVQPVDPAVDYFQMFGLEKKYEIEDKNLEGTYKDWQKKLHPDLVHSKSEKEKEYAAEQSARVIDAYRTLGNPLSRAIYILKLEGVEVDEEKTISDPELLAEMMEWREAVEEAADSHALSRIQSQIKEKLAAWSKSFAQAFQSQSYEEAQTCIQRMTYYNRVNEEIIKKL
ncbi:hypothetical protein NMG60_11001588 [Bertholletia excelsa]